MVQYLVSSAMLPKAIGKEFTDYTAIPIVYSQLEVDGIELVLLPEWDNHYPPITPTSADWNLCQKISGVEIINCFKQLQINIPSIHLNRDIGNLLCSNDQMLVERGQRILEENLEVASKLNSDIVVLHLWDTFKKQINIKDLFNKVYEVSQYFSVKLTIENIPISVQSINSLQAWSTLKKIMPNEYGFTLDLNWCSLYDNFEELLKEFSSIYNIHVQGYLNEHKRLVPRVGNLDLMKSIDKLKSLNYNHYITLELSKVTDVSDFIQSLKVIRKHI